MIKFSAGGFRDFTRIAASDPTMWRDVFLNNKEAVLEMLGRFNEDLAALTARDPHGATGRRCSISSRAPAAIRRSIIEIGQETAAPDFGRPHGGARADHARCRGLTLRATDRTPMSAADSEFWVFGYGSLMWRPEFDYLERRPARLLGAHRALCVFPTCTAGPPRNPASCSG